MKKIILLVSVLVQLNINAQTPVNITPEPAITNINQGEFLLTTQTTIISNSKTENSKKYLADYLLKFYKINLLSSNEKTKKVAVCADLP